MAKKEVKKFRKDTIWFDPTFNDYYLVIKKTKYKAVILWLYSSSEEHTISISSCAYDEFIRVITPLEKELI